MKKVKAINVPINKEFVFIVNNSLMVLLLSNEFKSGFKKNVLGRGFLINA
ncbi:hypothetical protein CFS9_23580 [Flavobacterium sp. CFS9]|uniref:Uncharacterized protein n=1 Tax=Flavobacterium sp. CFS9 TaxID=3143118 RepID=A0AAT9H2M0_9FLAO